MKKKKLIIFVLAIIFIILGGFIFNQQAKSKSVKDNMKLANKYVQDGKYEEAELALLKVISVEPKNIEARIQLAKAYTAEKKYDKAEQTLKDAAAIDVNDKAPKEELAELYILQGKELLSAGKLNDAKDMFDKAVDVDESRVKTYSQIADYYETTAGKVSEAMAILTEGYEETKDSGLKSRLDDMKEKITGNTNGNILHGGFVAQQGDWIYYSNPADSEKIYKVKTDGTGRFKLNDDGNCFYINVIGDWIYYVSPSDSIDTMYKIRTDGTQRTKIIDADKGFMYMMVSGDWIYYLKAESHGEYDYGRYMYKIKTDGTGNVKLDDENTAAMNVSGDWIYYVSWSDFNLYKIKIDGTQKSKICNECLCGHFGSAEINVSGDWIYYINIGDEYKLYKIRTDGTENTKLNDGYFNYIDVFNDSIYGLIRTDKSKEGSTMHKIKTDGSEKVKLNYYESCAINLIGDWIYVTNYESTKPVKLYKTKVEGTNLQIIN